MNSARQRILNSFKQGHVLKRYDEMPMKQRDILTKQLEYFEFDMIDLVSQSNQIKWYILFFHRFFSKGKNGKNKEFYLF